MVINFGEIIHCRALNSLTVPVVRWIDQHGGLLKSAATKQEILNVLALPHIDEALRMALTRSPARSRQLGGGAGRSRAADRQPVASQTALEDAPA